MVGSPGNLKVLGCVEHRFARAPDTRKKGGEGISKIDRQRSGTDNGACVKADVLR
jgi:hypothetical protein